MMAGSQSDAECNNSGGTHTEKKTDNRQTDMQADRERDKDTETHTDRERHRETDNDTQMTRYRDRGKCRDKTDADIQKEK